MREIALDGMIFIKSKSILLKIIKLDRFMWNVSWNWKRDVMIHGLRSTPRADLEREKCSIVMIKLVFLITFIP